MFFFLKYRLTPSPAIEVKQLNDAAMPACLPDTLYIRRGVQQLVSLDMPEGQLLLLGDPVCAEAKALGHMLVPAPGRFEESVIYENIKGHFYWFYIHEGGLRCGTSYGAIFPVYYHREKNHISLSSRASFLAEKLEAPARDRRNLLERLLFNYPFFDSTWWEEIKLLGAHCHFNLKWTTATIEDGFNLHRYFGEVETDNRESLAQLSEVFEEEIRPFFPEERFAVSMTGGFDGRTLVAAARQAGGEFFTYSFGRPGNSDVVLPMKQAGKLGLTHYPIFLDENYVKSESLESARSFLHLTEFNGNFGRPHYEFAARQLSEKVPYILTGNFGSELFRALHLPGVMMSECLIRIFTSKDDSWKDFLKQATTAWDKTLFNKELDALIADLEQYLHRMKDWEPNHRFYHFVFSEIARKYFGPELIMQSRYLRNRTPFLNLRFFRALNRTAWSGVHSRLFEKNKGKRMKGQFFYAAYLRQANPQLYRMPTNKGYRPADVLETWRFPLLLGQVAYRKFLKAEEKDDHSVEAFFRRYHPTLRADILAGSNDNFLQSLLKGSGADIDAGKALEKWIKFYSIAAGWQAALQPRLTQANIGTRPVLT